MVTEYARGQREYEVIGTDQRICDTNTRAFPFRFICNLDEAGSPFCTGTLIGPRTVLTAGHCINTTTPPVVTVIPGRNGADRNGPFGNARAVAFHLPPDQRDVTTTDFGAVVLDRPIGNQVGWWTFDYFRWPGDDNGHSILQNGLPLPASRLPVNLSGYPGDLPKDPRDPCFVAGRDLRGMFQYRAFDTVARLRADGILEYLHDTFFGMSGSPVWVRRHPTMGGRVMSALHIARDDDQAGTPLANRGILIRGPLRDFVRAHSFWPPAAPLPARALVRSGSRGAAVSELQHRLNIWIAITPGAGLARLAVDGIFGPLTLEVVRAFQRGMALAVDGIVGPQTWTRLLRPF